MSARNIIAMHHAMAQREDMQQIKADAANPTYQHPRDAKLAKLKGLIGADAYATWYAENQNGNMRVAAWEAIIDAAIAAALTPPADECECLPDGRACHVCKAKSADDSLPF